MKLDCGNNLVLRLPVKSDIAAFYALINTNREHLTTWRNWTAEMISLNRVQQFIERNAHAHRELLSPDFEHGTHPGFSFLLEHLDKPIGLAGFQGINRTNDIGAMGYWIDEKQQGRGFTTVACKAILAYGFDVLDLNRIEIQVLTTNAASIRVAEKLGFAREAILSEVEKGADAQYYDHYLFRMLRRDWKQ
jgi:ribosomal-protein-serine acetyltransferase